MRLVIQRVRKATVEANRREAARIGAGMVVFAGFTAQDRPTDFPHVAEHGPSLTKPRGFVRLQRCE